MIWAMTVDMHDEGRNEIHDSQVSRRRFLQGAGAAGLIATAPWLWPGAASARTAPRLLRETPIAGAPPPEQLHLQFGADAASQMSASWATPVRVTGHGCASASPGTATAR